MDELDDQVKSYQLLSTGLSYTQSLAGCAEPPSSCLNSSVVQQEPAISELKSPIAELDPPFVLVPSSTQLDPSLLNLKPFTTHIKQSNSTEDLSNAQLDTAFTQTLSQPVYPEPVISRFEPSPKTQSHFIYKHSSSSSSDGAGDSEAEMQDQHEASSLFKCLPMIDSSSDSDDDILLTWLVLRRHRLRKRRLAQRFYVRGKSSPEPVDLQSSVKKTKPVCDTPAKKQKQTQDSTTGDVQSSDNTGVKKRKWICESNTLRDELGEFSILAKQLQEDETRFMEYFRLSKDDFNFIFNRIKPLIYKQSTRFRASIPTEQRFAICLRFLATGENFRNLSSAFRCGHSTVSNIVGDVCAAICQAFNEDFLPMLTELDWKDRAKKINEKCGFPLCLGALGCKSLKLKASNKKSYPLLLLVAVDADHKFSMVDAGSYGLKSDTDAFKESCFGQALNSNSLNIPQNELFWTDEKGSGIFPYVFVAEKAFPLKNHIVKPYSGQDVSSDNQIFNNRLKEVNRLSETALDMLSERFCFFHKGLDVDEKKAILIVRTACLLHNIIQVKNDIKKPLFNSNFNKSAYKDVTKLSGNRPTQEAMFVRNKFQEYFKSWCGLAS